MPTSTKPGVNPMEVFVSFYGRCMRRLMRYVAVVVFSGGYVIHALAAESPATAFAAYMQEIGAKAEREPAGAALPFERFSRVLSQSQEYAEAGRFREAAHRLRALQTMPDLPDFFAPWIRGRLEALGRLEHRVDITTLRALFVDADPHWFRKRLKPIATAWRAPAHDSASKLQLMADLFGQSEDARGQRLALLALVDTGALPPGQVAEALLEAGNRAQQDHDIAAAVQTWERVVNQYPQTAAWFKALYNLGAAKKETQAARAAIAHFTRLIESSPPNLEPGAQLMENYRNYSHQAALGLSDCHEALGEFGVALQWAQRATDQYRLEAWCGTCATESAVALAARIDRLKSKAGGGR